MRLSISGQVDPVSTEANLEGTTGRENTSVPICDPSRLLRKRKQRSGEWERENTTTAHCAGPKHPMRGNKSSEVVRDLIPVNLCSTETGGSKRTLAEHGTFPPKGGFKSRDSPFMHLLFIPLRTKLPAWSLRTASTCLELHSARFAKMDNGKRSLKWRRRTVTVKFRMGGVFRARSASRFAKSIPQT